VMKWFLDASDTGEPAKYEVIVTANYVPIALSRFGGSEIAAELPHRGIVSEISGFTVVWR
jgi:hypothetical protein